MDYVSKIIVYFYIFCGIYLDCDDDDPRSGYYCYLKGYNAGCCDTPFTVSSLSL